MPNAYNRAAFHSVAVDQNIHVLVRVYCALVLIELALKDEIGSSNLGHDIPSMLQRLGKNPHNRHCRAALNKHRAELANKLSSLRTQTVSNLSGFVSPKVFPGLRYLRHISDWPTDASTDVEIEDLRICVDKIRHFLKNNVRLSLPI
jgi:hypothetical protein